MGQKWWRAVLGHLGATKARRRCEWHTTAPGTCFLIYPSPLPSEGGGARNSTAHVTAKENEVQRSQRFPYAVETVSPDSSLDSLTRSQD